MHLLLTLAGFGWLAPLVSLWPWALAIGAGAALLGVRGGAAALFKGLPWVAAGVLLAAAMVQRVQVVHRDETIVKVTGERDRIVSVVTDATVPPDAKGRRRPLTPDEALAAAQGLTRDRDDARRSLATINTRTIEAAARAKVDDAALVHTQAGLEQERQRSLPVIEHLSAVKAPGTENGDAAMIADASDDAWKDWK